MTLPSHISKKRDELVEKTCNDNVSIDNIELVEMWNAGFAEAKKQAEGLVDAIRHTLGEFALYNEEEDANKWPKFILKCEKNLAAYREKMGE
jgi:hypothetical protein